MLQKGRVIVNNQAPKAKNSSKTRAKPGKGKDPHRIVESYEILDGAVDIIRTTKSGKFWSMSCWLRQEGKCYRRSLRTKNLEEAKEYARDQYFKLQSDIRAGNKIFTKTFKELVDAFLEHKQLEANSGLISEGRVQTVRIASRKWISKFVGENTNLDKINRHTFEKYYIWRREQAADVRNATLINERALISSIFKFGVAHGILRSDQTPSNLIFPRLNIKKSQVERRDDLELAEWEQMYRAFRRWVAKGETDKEKDQRKFVRDFIILSVNTGLRFGEMRKLKWRSIKLFKDKKTFKTGDGIKTSVEIRVPEDTKTGARTVIGRRGDIFERIKSYSKNTKAEDWIFCDNATGEQLHKKVYYKLWADLLKECELDGSAKKLSFYSLRHTYITFRLLSGVSPFMLAENTGTSIRMIEVHYAHIKSEHLRRELTKEMIRDEAGQILIE